MKTAILISGKASSGKTTIADMMMIMMASKGAMPCIEYISKDMKEWAAADFKKLTEYLNSVADEVINIAKVVCEPIPYDKPTELIEKVLKKFVVTGDNWTNSKTDLSRILLQIYGTEIFQTRIHLDYWCSRLLVRPTIVDNDIVIIPDVRWRSNIDFFNGIDGVSAYTIRINRPGIRVSNHPSETNLDSYKDWYAVINNDGSMEDLNKKTSEIVNTILSESTNNVKDVEV